MSNSNKIKALEIDCWDHATIRRRAESSRREAMSTSPFSLRAAFGLMLNRTGRRSGS